MTLADFVYPAYVPWITCPQRLKLFGFPTDEGHYRNMLLHTKLDRYSFIFYVIYAKVETFTGLQETHDKSSVLEMFRNIVTLIVP